MASDVSQRGAWFTQARFGMFIHWGIYAALGRGEWVMHEERIPRDEYNRLADQFRPRPGVAREWAALAKEAGMRYAVLTTKHHDGFCLFDSQTTDFTSVKTAAGRDLVAEFVAACRQEGLRIGFYYSLMDWQWPIQFEGADKDPTLFKQAIDYIHAQVRELCTQYGKVDVMWYDGAWPLSVEQWRSAELNAMVRELQPDILINDRAALSEDIDTPEQYIKASEPGRLWETCMCIADRWGYYRGDNDNKSTAHLIHDLTRVASGNGAYLLNVGPLPDGTIPELQQQRLREMGAWLQVNGESVYGTERSPYERHKSFGTTTVRGNTVYVHVWRWVGPEFCFAEVKNRVKEAFFLATGEPVKFRQIGERVIFTDMPEESPDPADTVIVLRMEGDSLETIDQWAAW